ncbi:MAG: EF-P lysine aminoacylase GenX [Planctomycetes bacterium]|nr:EF-P lysine aminoacylase GenX [Planctomycetota bacterium]MCH9726809.1 EF-P lysine aminoacylase GenX [Planctomycetota bacterium]MCH9775436.1 EF-P lysine aminoacylase GenX [Planctomycetota bacterium]MCH9790185.1 EF-P lysine aminoacylase GenX [Planctomycetota bacterium]
MNQSVPDSSDYLPTASIEMLKQRSHLLHAVRDFFEAYGYWEVETPILSRDSVVDAHIDPFTTEWRSDEGRGVDQKSLQIIRYLQTSPEFAMKRLMTAGADQIYQITHAFRQAERGTLHNPEFSMLEWYRRGETHIDQMTFVELLVRHIYDAAASASDQSTRTMLPDDQFRRLSYEDAFLKYADLSALNSTAEAFQRMAIEKQISVPSGFDQNDCLSWQNLFLVEVVEPALRKWGAVFLYDYPPEQAALACIRQDENPGPGGVAERFELYLQGIEICNGYHELTDPLELRTRIKQQATQRLKENRPALPEESYLLQAMEAGLPACAGTALGLDRLVMLALGKQSLKDVIAFPFERA